MLLRTLKIFTFLGLAFTVLFGSQSANANIDAFVALGSTVTHHDYVIGPDGSFRVYSNGSGVYVSNDYGATFTRTLSVSFHQLLLGVSPNMQYMVAGGVKTYFMDTNRVSTDQIYYSSDYGATWTQRGLLSKMSWKDFKISNDGQKILGITVAQTGKDQDGWNVYTGFGSSFYSSDAGQSFSEVKAITSTDGDRQWKSIAMADDGSSMYMTKEGAGLWRSTDGTNWTLITTGYSHVATSSTGQYVYAIGPTKNFKNSNYGQGTWSSMTSAPTNILPANLSVSADGQYILIGAVDDGIWESRNGGTTFRESPVFVGSTDYPLMNWKAFGIAMNAPGTYVLINSEYGFFIGKRVPDRVSGLSASSQEDKQVTLSWNAPLNNGYQISNYKIYWSTEPYFAITTWNELTRAADTSTTVVVTGLMNGYSYTYKVAAVNANGDGQFSDIATGDPSGGPESVTAVSALAGDQKITLTWTAPENTGGWSLQDYKIGYKPTGGSWTDFQTSSIAESATVTGLTNGTAYSLRITAISFWGEGETYLLSETVTPRTVPSAPTNLSATRANGSVLLNWDTPSSDGGDSISNYRIEYSSNGGSTWSTFSRSDSTANTETVTSLSNGTTYSFRVSAVNGAGFSLASSTVTATPSTLPSAPTNLVATASNESVSIAFTAGSNGGASISDYFIEFSTDGGQSWTTYNNAPVTSSPIILGDLTNYTPYKFRIAAINLNGTGSASQATSSVTPRGTLTSIVLSTSSLGTAAGAVFTTQPRVTLNDQNFSTMLSDSSTVVTATISSGGTLVGTRTATANSGVATFIDLGISGTAGTTYTVTYSVAGVTAVTQSVTVSRGTATKLYVSRNSSGAQTGTTFTTQPVITITDTGNNTVTSYVNTVITASVNNSTCFLATTAETKTATSGSATFASLGLSAQSGTECLITYSASNLISASETITVTSGPAANIDRTTRPDNAYYGRPFGQQPVYRITDTAGNTVTTDNSTVLTISTPSNIGATILQESRTAVNGIVTFTGLGFSGIDAGSFVSYRVTPNSFSAFFADSVLIFAGDPVLSWSNSSKINGSPSYTVSAPTSNADGTFSYTSSDPSVATVSGSTITIVGQGTTTLTATLTPANTNNFNSGVSVTSTLTVSGGASSITISIAGGVLTVQKGSAVTITASVNVAGKVKFLANGKVIGGCASKSATSSATCSWKPSIQGQKVTLSASLNPTSNSYSNARSNNLDVGVTRRTGLR